MTSICTYLTEITDTNRTKVYLYPADTRVETDINWHSCGRGSDDTLASIDTVEAHLKAVMHSWTRQFQPADGCGDGNSCNPRHGRRATFYCWYSEQDGTLEMCLTSADQDHLPFRANVRLLDSPRPILAQLLTEETPGTIMLDDLIECSPDAAWACAQDTEYIVNVWAETHTW